MEEGLADWDVKDLSRLVKKKSGKGTKIINRRNELSTSDLVLSVFREFEEDVSDEEETEAEDEETATNTHIINIDDSSDDEDILMTKKLPKMKGEPLPIYVKGDSGALDCGVQSLLLLLRIFLIGENCLLSAAYLVPRLVG